MFTMKTNTDTNLLFPPENLAISYPLNTAKDLDTLMERIGDASLVLLGEASHGTFLFIDETKALHPLHIKPDGHKTPDTYPFGI